MPKCVTLGCPGPVCEEERSDIEIQNRLNS
jgi:hypothetical protein